MKMQSERLLIFVLLVMPSHKLCAQGKGLQIFEAIYEWTRQFASFKADKPLIRKFIEGKPLITTQYLIERQGYPCETHRVTTKDGYILELHRIPFGIHPRRPQPSTLKSRNPVIVSHGDIQSSADMVLSTPVEDAIGFHLADSGYDVWITNQRGNDYSTRHVSLSPLQSKFWEFSFHEIGMYDIPAVIDYVIKKTEHKKVNFVGFSLGNVNLLVALAKRPEYNKKILGTVFMAPAGIYYEGFAFGLANVLAPLAPLYKIISDYIGGGLIFGQALTNLLHRIAPIICDPRVDIFRICLILFNAILGDDGGLITQEKLQQIFSVSPNPMPIRLTSHFLQLAGPGEFNEYDFGIRRNLEIYGRPKPPRYNLTNVRIPVAVMVGAADRIGSPVDGWRLARQLPKLVDFFLVKYPHFTHSDFCYARGAGKLVYSKVVSYLDLFSTGNTINYESENTI